MSCGQIALVELNIPIDTYYASEIYDKAIQVTQENFPNTIQCGDLLKIYQNETGGNNLNIIYQSNNGQIIHGDNIEVMKTFADNSIDSCVSDFPYDLSFMSRKWDTTGNFYEWCKTRAIELYRVMKPGGYVAIFGHPKTNHRMKCAFEDCGFKIVEEIDWVYLSGFPKNQDIGKLFDKANDKEFAEKYKNFKTAGLKPAHEPITIFQKPLDGTYIENIRKYGCGGMNIDACRVGVETIKTNGKRNGTGNSLEWSKYKSPENFIGEIHIGRFPPNMIFDEYMAQELDNQTGIRTSGTNCVRTKEGTFFEHGGLGKAGDVQITYGDTGGGSRMFPIIKYCTKVSPKERKLPNGERNLHVTLKPKELIKWLIKLVTPKDGTTIDITAGSCTHAVAVEELNRDKGYNLKYIDIELMNTETEPYCDVGKMRVESIVKNMS